MLYIIPFQLPLKNYILWKYGASPPSQIHSARVSMGPMLWLSPTEDPVSAAVFVLPVVEVRWLETSSCTYIAIKRSQTKVRPGAPYESVEMEKKKKKGFLVGMVSFALIIYVFPSPVNI